MIQRKNLGLLLCVTLTAVFLTSCHKSKSSDDTIPLPQRIGDTTLNSPTSPETDKGPPTNTTTSSAEAVEIAAARAKLVVAPWNQSNMSATLQKLQSYAFVFDNQNVSLVSNCSFFIDGSSQTVTASAPYTLNSKTLVILGSNSNSTIYKNIKCESRLEAGEWAYKFEENKLVLTKGTQILTLELTGKL